MIYRSNYVKEEMSKTIMFSSKNKLTLLLYALLFAAISFVLSSTCQVLNDTAVNSIFSRGAEKSIYSIFLLSHIATLIFCSVYMFKNYKDMTFADIKSNRVYLLKKLNISSTKVLIFRLLSSLLFPIVFYTSTCAASFIFCLFMNYSINLKNAIGVFVIGVVKMIASSSLIVFLSTIFKHRRYSSLIYIVVFILDLCFMYFNGMVYLSGASSRMTLRNLFGPASWCYGVCLIGFSLIMIGLTIVLACNEMQYYFRRDQRIENIITIDYVSSEVIPEKKDKTKIKDLIYKACVNTFIGLLFVGGLVTNFAMLFMNKTTLENENDIGHKVTLLFNDNLMAYVEDDSVESKYIYKNDLATFEVISQDADVNVGDIVYYYSMEDGKCIVQRVTRIELDTYYVDYSLYPVGYEEGE
ncbi:MAG: hypothetical protein HUJ61_04115, partial [Bacilli bacterium]|nr:hypothetical protein [Bacilli bacterium]